MSSSDPDEDWEHTVELAKAAPRVILSADDKIGMWRLETALNLGYDVETAESLAVSDADMYVLEYRLIRRGCPLSLAARIV